MTLKNARVPKKTPFERSYWVVPGKFLAGYYPGDRQMSVIKQKMSDLLACGIRCVINLMEPDERDHEGLPFVDYAPVLKTLANGRAIVDCQRMPIPNLWIPSRDFMVQVLDWIDNTLGENRPVYIHCWGGQGRTGTVIGCWLIRHGIAKSENVLEKISELRRFETKAQNPSPITPDQIQMVLQWNKGE